MDVTCANLMPAADGLPGKRDARAFSLRYVSTTQNSFFMTVLYTAQCAVQHQSLLKKVTASTMTQQPPPNPSLSIPPTPVDHLPSKQREIEQRSNGKKAFILNICSDPTKGKEAVAVIPNLSNGERFAAFIITTRFLCPDPTLYVVHHALGELASS